MPINGIAGICSPCGAFSTGTKSGGGCPCPSFAKATEGKAVTAAHATTRKNGKLKTFILSFPPVFLATGYWLRS